MPSIEAANLLIDLVEHGPVTGSTPMKFTAGKDLAALLQQSSWATHTLAQARRVAKVPAGLDADLFGPLGCSISTGAGAVLNALKPRPGTSIAIFGAGNPVERLVRRYPFAEINQAIADSDSGVALRPILMMPESASLLPPPSVRHA